MVTFPIAFSTSWPSKQKYNYQADLLTVTAIFISHCDATVREQADSHFTAQAGHKNKIKAGLLFGEPRQPPVHLFQQLGHSKASFQGQNIRKEERCKRQKRQTPTVQGGCLYGQACFQFSDLSWNQGMGILKNLYKAICSSEQRDTLPLSKCIGKSCQPLHHLELLQCLVMEGIPLNHERHKGVSVEHFIIHRTLDAFQSASEFSMFHYFGWSVSCLAD